QATLSDEAKANLESEINRLQTSLQRDQQDAQTDYQEDSDRMVQGIYTKLVQATTKVAQENQIMLVFDVSSQPNNLVCCGSAMDITKQVVEEYDKANPSTGASTTTAAPAPGTTSAPPKATPPPAARPPASGSSVPRPPAGNKRDCGTDITWAKQIASPIFLCVKRQPMQGKAYVTLAVLMLGSAVAALALSWTAPGREFDQH